MSIINENNYTMRCPSYIDRYDINLFYLIVLFSHVSVLSYTIIFDLF